MYSIIPTHGNTISLLWGGGGGGGVILGVSGPEEGELTFKIFACLMGNTFREKER